MSEFGPPDPNAHNFVAPTPAVAPFAPPSPDAVRFHGILPPVGYGRLFDLSHIPVAPAPTMPNILTITPAEGTSTTLLGSLGLDSDPGNPWSRSGPSVAPVIAPSPTSPWAPPNPNNTDPSLVAPTLPPGHPDAPLIPWHLRPVSVNPFIEKPKKRPPLVERAGLEHLVRPLTPLPPKKRGAIKWLRDATKPKTEHGGNLDIPKLKLRNLGRLAMHGFGSIARVDRIVDAASLPRTRLEHTMIADRKSENKAARHQARAAKRAAPKQPSRVGAAVRRGAKAAGRVVGNSARSVREKVADKSVDRLSRRAEAAHNIGRAAYTELDNSKHLMSEKEARQIAATAINKTNRYHRLNRKAQGKTASNAKRRAAAQLKRANITVV